MSLGTHLSTGNSGDAASAAPSILSAHPRAVRSPEPGRSPLAGWRHLGRALVAVTALWSSACTNLPNLTENEPKNGCLLAALNERDVIRAKNYMRPNVETHLLAIWFQDSRHMALVVRGDHHWFAWDDTYGGRPLFLENQKHLPDPIKAAQAAFPRREVTLAWWAD